MTDYRQWWGIQTIDSGDFTGTRLPVVSALQVNPTDANARHKIYSAFTWKNLTVVAQSNTADDNAPITCRDTNVSTTVTVTVTASTTGHFEDTANTHSLAANDYINMLVGDNNITVGSLVCYGGSTLSSASAVGHNFGSDDSTIGNGTVRYGSLNGDMTFSASSQVNSQFTARHTPTFDSYQVYLSSHSVTGGTPTCALQVNGADTALVLSLTGTGEFQDTANTAVVSAGDELNYRASRIGSAGSFVLRNSTARHNAAKLNVGTYQVWNLASATTEYRPMMCTSGQTATEGDIDQNARTTELATNACIMIGTNTAASASTFALRAGAVSKLTVTITASTTGLFEDTVSTYTFGATDQVALMLTQGAAAGSLGALTESIEIPSTAAAVSVGGPLAGSMHLIGGVLVGGRLAQ